MTVLCAVSLVTSCKKVKEQEKPVKVVETNFTVGLNSVQAEYAEVVVRHTGAADVTWFGFVTEDVTGPEQDLISAQLAQLDKKALHVGNSQTVALPGLKEYVTYRYIAFPVNEAGETFGTGAQQLRHPAFCQRGRRDLRNERQHHLQHFPQV